MSRMVWLNCMGIPPNVGWLNTFISVEEETYKKISFSRARILMVTEEESKINKWIKLDGKGKIYNVKIWEEMYHEPNQDKTATKPRNGAKGNEIKDPEKLRSKRDVEQTYQMSNRLHVNEEEYDSANISQGEDEGQAWGIARAISKSTSVQQKAR